MSEPHTIPTYGDLLATGTYVTVLRHRGFLLCRPPEPVRKVVYEAAMANVLPYVADGPATTKNTYETKLVFPNCRLDFNGMYENQIINYVGVKELSRDFPAINSGDRQTGPFNLHTTFCVTMEELDELSAWLRLLGRTEGGDPSDGWAARQYRPSQLKGGTRRP